MNRSPVTLLIMMIAIALLILPTAQAADIEVSDSCSFADAINAANRDGTVGGCPAGDAADTISLSSDITLAVALPHITSEITIEGRGFTISGNNRFRIFAVNGGNLTVNNLTMTRGFADWGGAIVNVNRGMLTISQSAITYSEAAEGGAIGNEGVVTIENSKVSRNLAEYGGAIHTSKGTITIQGSDINNNNAKPGDGGAIYVVSGKLSLADSLITSNASINDGGSIYFNDGEMDISGSIFSNNSTTGVYTSGGAIIIEAGKLSVSRSDFVRNKSTMFGGAILNSGGSAHISEGTFLRNMSDNNGGAIYNSSSSVLHLRDCSFLMNFSERSGGAISSWGKMTAANCFFGSNQAQEDGGGIHVKERQSELYHLTMLNNSAKRGGGLFRDVDGNAHIYSSILASSHQGGDCFGRLSSNVANLIADGSCFATLSGDPMLGELVEPEDGSPAYFPLLEASPAIDAAADEYCPDTDIIGTPRPQGDTCDIGAYELVVAP